MMLEQKHIDPLVGLQISAQTDNFALLSAVFAYVIRTNHKNQSYYLGRLPIF